MSHWRRANTAGGACFFTVASHRRQKIFCDERIHNTLREGIERTWQKYPFEINAWVLLPDHLHCLWTLPERNANFPVRWAKIKRHVSLVFGDRYKRFEELSDTGKKNCESDLVAAALSGTPNT